MSQLVKYGTHVIASKRVSQNLLAHVAGEIGAARDAGKRGEDDAEQVDKREEVAVFRKRVVAVGVVVLARVTLEAARRRAREECLRVNRMDDVVKRRCRVFGTGEEKAAYGYMYILCVVKCKLA